MQNQNETVSIAPSAVVGEGEGSSASSKTGAGEAAVLRAGPWRGRRRPGWSVARREPPSPMHFVICIGLYQGISGIRKASIFHKSYRTRYFMVV